MNRWARFYTELRVSSVGWRQRRSLFKVILGFVVTIGCLTIAVWNINLRELKEILWAGDYRLLPVFLGILSIIFWLKLIRWRLILLPLGNFKMRQLVAPMMIGFMANNLLPARLGEIARGLILSRQHGLDSASTIATVALERILDVFAILLFLALGVLFSVELTESRGFLSLSIGAVSLLALLAVFAYSIWTDFLVGMIRRVFSRFGLLRFRLFGLLVRLMESTGQGLASLRNPRLFWRLAFTSLLHWFLMATMVYIALKAFSISASPLVAMVVMSVTALGVAAPSSPGFFGVVQLGFWVSLKPFGVEKADAFAASVYFHLAQYIPVTLTGLFFLYRLGFSLLQKRQNLNDEPNCPAKPFDSAGDTSLEPRT